VVTRLPIGLLLGASCSLVIACASASKQSASPSAPATAGGAEPGSLGGMGPLDEIRTLDREIEASLTGMGVKPTPAAACAADQSCAQSAPLSMGMTPAVEDPTCKVGASETCQDSCKLSDSICRNADRICILAKEIGGTDAYANETCVRGNASCKASRERCCGCI
jgi:hypothetical protein